MNRRQFIAGAAAGVAAAAGAAQPSARLRVAVIGHTGRGNYGHKIDEVWLKIPETEIVAVADADSKGLAAARKRLKNPPGYPDYRAMLAETKPDIVAIGPRFIDEHRDMALAAIAAGARGVYIEKPFCRTPAEADEILAACARRNVKLAVAHRNRYHPALATVRSMMEAGAIGRVVELRGRGKEDQRGGAEDLWVLGCHIFDLARALAGEPAACSAVLLQDGRPVTRAEIQDGAEGVGPLGGNEVHARFEMKSGAPVFFDSIKKAGDNGGTFGLQVIGTKGIIDLSVDKEPLAHLLAGNPFLPSETPRGWIPITSAGPGKPEPLEGLAEKIASHEAGARDLIAAIREDRPPLCGAREGAATVEMIAAVFESHRLGGRRVTLPLEKRGNPLGQL